MNLLMTLLVTWNNCINCLFLNVTVFSNIKDYSRSPEDSFRNSLLVYLKIKQKAIDCIQKDKKYCRKKLFFQFIEFILVGPLIFWLGP